MFNILRLFSRTPKSSKPSRPSTSTSLSHPLHPTYASLRLALPTHLPVLLQRRRTPSEFERLSILWNEQVDALLAQYARRDLNARAGAGGMQPFTWEEHEHNVEHLMELYEGLCIVDPCVVLGEPSRPPLQKRHSRRRAPSPLDEGPVYCARQGPPSYVARRTASSASAAELRWSPGVVACPELLHSPCVSEVSSCGPATPESEIPPLVLTANLAHEQALSCAAPATAARKLELEHRAPPPSPGTLAEKRKQRISRRVSALPGRGPPGENERMRGAPRVRFATT